MTRLLHCADLHLSQAESAYSLAVLEGVVETAAKEDVSLLLFAGDVFDTFADLDALRTDFVKILDRLPAATAALMIGGNHEEHGRGGRSFARRSFGRCRVAEEMPFERVEFGGVEVLALPYRPSYADYPDWAVPPGSGRPRVVLAHGTVTGASFLPPDEETAAVIDPDLFVRLGADYAALGHIHAGRNLTLSGVVVCYPGSARVRSRGEFGPRCVAVVEFAASSRAPSALRRVIVPNAGEYREIVVPVEPDGSAPGLDGAGGRWGRDDYVLLRPEGVVENGAEFGRRLAAAAARLSSSARHLAVDDSGVMTLEGASAERLMSGFLERWKAREPGAGEREVWYRARRLGLEAIRAVLEARR